MTVGSGPSPQATAKSLESRSTEYRHQFCPVCEQIPLRDNVEADDA